MADFRSPFDAMILREGGYTLTDIAGDRGGQTYAGIARKFHPGWPGWPAIDGGTTPATDLVRDFYRREFWDVVHGDDLPQEIAASLFDFAVNAGAPVAIKLAQIVAGLAPDGALGPKSIAALNLIDPGTFRAAYTLAKIKRYVDICMRDRGQSKFLLGWVRRSLEQLA